MTESKPRLAMNPLERLIRDTTQDKPDQPAAPSAAARPKPSKPAARGKRAPVDPATAQAEAKLRDDIGRGKGTNFYVNKNGDVLQKILIYLPFEYVRQLKREAIDARLSLSALIGKRLRGEVVHTGE